MAYRCVICEKVFTDDEIENALEISVGRGRSRVPITYQLADGTYHSLRKIPVKRQPQSPSPEPKQNSESLLEVANALAALRTPPIPEPELKIEPLPQIEPDLEEVEGLTPFQLAFRRIQEKSK